MSEEATTRIAGFLLRGILILLQVLFEYILMFFGYITARAVVPAVSLGRIRIVSFHSHETGFNPFGYKRDPNGQLVCSAYAAALLGFGIWILLVLSVLALSATLKYFG